MMLRAGHLAGAPAGHTHSDLLSRQGAWWPMEGTIAITRNVETPRPAWRKTGLPI